MIFSQRKILFSYLPRLPWRLLTSGGAVVSLSERPAAHSSSSSPAGVITETRGLRDKSADHSVVCVNLCLAVAVKEGNSSWPAWWGMIPLGSFSVGSAPLVASSVSGWRNPEHLARSLSSLLVFGRIRIFASFHPSWRNNNLAKRSWSSTACGTGFCWNGSNW